MALRLNIIEIIYYKKKRISLEVELARWYIRREILIQVGRGHAIDNNTFMIYYAVTNCNDSEKSASTLNPLLKLRPSRFASTCYMSIYV
jgi:hypothetical protein